MTLTPDALGDTAEALLKKHSGSVIDAAKAFAAILEKNADLRLSLSLMFIKTLASRAEPSRRKAGPHRRMTPKGPTVRQKSGALRAEKEFTNEIFARKLRGGRTLGEIHIQELRAIAQASAETAVSFFSRGYEDAVDMFACTMLVNHCVAADPLALVRDCIKPAIAAATYEQARIAAAEALRDGSAAMAKHLLEQAATRSAHLSIGQ